MNSPTLALVATMALCACKPDTSKQVDALRDVEAASTNAEAARIAASKTDSPPAMAVDYAVALSKLEVAKQAAMAAGAGPREIETRESLARLQVASEDRKAREAAAANAMQAKRQLDADLKKIDQGHAAKLAESEEADQQRKAQEILRDLEEWKRKNGIPDTPPPARPSSVPGLPDGMEPAGKAAK